MPGSTQDEANTAASGRRGFGLGGVVLALCFAILTVQTWRKWGDMVVDFGVQLYLPWKLSTGAVLYRDVAYLTGGPLSQYYHAWLFRIFGVSILTIVVSNLVILAFLVSAVYAGVYRISDAWTATIAGLALVLVFAFGHYTAYGTFNYVSPYSHELVHGMVLSIAVLWLLSRWLLKETIPLALLAGIGKRVGLVDQAGGFSGAGAGASRRAGSILASQEEAGFAGAFGPGHGRRSGFAVGRVPPVFHPARKS